MEFREHDRRKPDLIERQGAAVLMIMVLALVILTVWLAFF